MPLDYQSDEGGSTSRNGIPNGALTVLIIAAIAIVSVVVTLFCMLVNNRRTARLRQRTQRIAPNALRLSAGSGVTSPADTPRPANYPPMYICSSFDPKFDAPPSYEEAVRTMVANGGNGDVAVLTTPTVITIPEPTPSTSAAQIDVEMVHANLPSNSANVV